MSDFPLRLEELRNGTFRVYWNLAYSDRPHAPRGGFKLISGELSIQVHQNSVSNVARDADYLHHYS